MKTSWQFEIGTKGSLPNLEKTLLHEHAQLAATVDTLALCKHFQHSWVRLCQGCWDVGTFPHSRCALRSPCMPSNRIRLPYASSILFRGSCAHPYTIVQFHDTFLSCTSGIWKHALRLSSLLSTCNTTSFHANVIDPETLNSAGAIADKVFVLLIEHILA